MREVAPGATYRLQFNRDFTFSDAEKIVPYLSALGITHVYASPLFAARAGSRHGYDVVDYTILNPELGTREDFDRFIGTLHRHDMGLLLDIVPNHMGIGGSENAWWNDVLKRGSDSSYADWFDIDWNASGEKLRYRRFFNVDDLSGVRVESAACFAQTHRLLFALIEDGSVQGVRVDHIDGLFDPKGYCELLRAHGYATGFPLYIVVEKILARHERVPENWCVDGTTGYEFCSVVTALFADARSEKRFDDVYRSFTRERERFDQTAYASKTAVVDDMFSGELEAFASSLCHIANSRPASSAYSEDCLRSALREICIAFPAYRTYVAGEGASEEDRRVVQEAVALARRRAPEIDDAVFSFVSSILTTEAVYRDDPRYERRETLAFAMKFQQYTPAFMAKGVEDTAFYRYVRLLSLNEVGGDPSRFGVSLEDFHQEMYERAKFSPHGLCATSTHDCKRGEDVRARINVLSEMPERWERDLAMFERCNLRHKREAGGSLAPDRTDEYFLYQILLGSWPPEIDASSLYTSQARAYGARIEAYLVKAMREARRRSSWISPDKAYEDATLAFFQGIFAEPSDSPFWERFFALLEPIARIGMLNGLGQTLLKITAPGVPDFYQGSELWDLSLVDPDNRGPVDFERREKMLETIPFSPNRSQARELLEKWKDGRVKAATIGIALAARRERREAFSCGDGYAALEVTGDHAERVVALENGGCVTIVPRLLTPLLSEVAPFPLGEDVWKRTMLGVPGRLRGRRLRSAFTGEHIVLRESTSIAEIFRDFPVALLIPDDPDEKQAGMA
jgi:(1->4)-alpha-D-glucan 1-alpha-D-glucosylmutase